jgi:hypothetical protein
MTEPRRIGRWFFAATGNHAQYIRIGRLVLHRDRGELWHPIFLRRRPR